MLWIAMETGAPEDALLVLDTLSGPDSQLFENCTSPVSLFAYMSDFYFWIKQMV